MTTAMFVKVKKIIRAFGSGHIGCYRQPGQDPTNHRYRNVILTNALDELSYFSGEEEISLLYSYYSCIAAPEAVRHSIPESQP
jgi:hypothetical protein